MSRSPTSSASCRKRDFWSSRTTSDRFAIVPHARYADVSGRLLGDLIERVFGGSREQLLLRLVEDRKLNAKERALLKDILKERE